MIIKNSNQKLKNKGDRKNNHLYQQHIIFYKKLKTTNHPEKAHLSYQKDRFLSS